jgi:hypothetical protein
VTVLVPGVKVPLLVKLPFIAIAELPAVNMPPLLTKLPPNVKARLLVANVAPLLMVSGTEALKTLALLSVMAPVLAIITPPVATNGVIHSAAPAVRLVAVSYFRVAAEPYVNVFPPSASVAVPCIDKVPLTVKLTPIVFAPEPERVRLLYGPARSASIV